MQQIDDLVYYDSNSDDDDENNDNIFHNTIQVEDVIEKTNDADDNIHGKPINNGFLHPIGQQKGTTGMIFGHEGALYVQYCLCGSFTTYHTKSTVVTFIKLKKRWIE